MFENEKKGFNIGSMRDKVKEARKGEEDKSVEKLFRKNFSWQAITEVTETTSSYNGPRLCDFGSEKIFFIFRERMRFCTCD